MSINFEKQSEFVEYPSRMRVLMWTFLALLAVIIGGVLVALGLSEEVNRLKGIVVGIACVVFFGLGFLYGLYRLINRQPSIIMNKEGITDNSSLSGAGRVKWTEIQDIRMYVYLGQKMIGLFLYDNDQFIARQSGLKKYIARMNRKLVPTSVNISQHGITMPLEQLYERILENWRNA